MQSGYMTTPQKKSSAGRKKADRHKPSRHIRVTERLARQLDVLADRNATSAPVEANRLIREGLEQLGLWPPSDDASS